MLVAARKEYPGMLEDGRRRILAGETSMAEVLRVTNDGTLQQEAPVGHVSITMLAEGDLVFSFVVFGEEGSDREFPSLLHNCPTVDGSKRSYNGAWARTATLPASRSD